MLRNKLSDPPPPRDVVQRMNDPIIYKFKSLKILKKPKPFITKSGLAKEMRSREAFNAPSIDDTKCELYPVSNAKFSVELNVTIMKRFPVDIVRLILILNILINYWAVQ